MRGASNLLIAIASLISLTLCVFFMVVWIRSYWITLSYVTEVEPELIAFQSHRGALHYVHVDAPRLKQSERKHPPLGRTTAPTDAALLWQDWNGPSPSTYTLLGFAFASSVSGYTIAAVPYWPIVGLTAILPIWSLPRMLRWGRKARVKCPQCRKWIEGLAESCPHCGHALVPSGPPPPPIHEAPPPPRPSKHVESVVIKTATPDRTPALPTDGSDKSA